MRTLIDAIKTRIRSHEGFKSNSYLETRYRTGGNSGPGSYGHLATFKADVLNRFVNERNVESVIEFGCGDGNQLTLSNYPKYTGYDVSHEAVNTCRELFKHDSSKEFFHLSTYDRRKANLSISLDVIFHLIEDEVFDAYMRMLFDASCKYVAIYSSNQDEPINPTSIHVRHRRFSTWIEKQLLPHQTWSMIASVRNPYPYDGDSNRTSFSDFFFYEKK